MPEDQNNDHVKDTEQLVSPSLPFTEEAEETELPVLPLASAPKIGLLNKEAVSTLQNQQDGLPMEVHHHGHVHHEKKWKEYIFQFFMLFLAVFCGFLAENQREHYIESLRIKEYMHGMTDDLKADTTVLKNTLVSLNRLVERFDSLQPVLQSFDKEENLRAHYFMASLLIATMDFTATIRTSEQLRNTGYYRLIKNKSLLDSLVYYDTRVRKGEDYWQTQRLQERNELMNLQAKIFDVSRIRRIREARQSNEDSQHLYDGLRIMTTDKELMNEYYNKIVNYRYACFNQAFLHQFLIDKAVGLINLIEKEYD